MADRIIDNQASKDVPNLPEDLNKVLVYALNQGRDTIKEGEVLVPFTVLLVGDKPFSRQHPGDNPQECFNLAKHEVEGARGAKAYAFCYDGYLDTNQGTKDAVIAEGGMPGEPNGYAIGYLYTIDSDGNASFGTTPSYIGNAPNFMASLKEEETVDEGEKSEKSEEPEEIDTIESGEELERKNAEGFGEPVKED